MSLWKFEAGSWRLEKRLLSPIALLITRTRIMMSILVLILITSTALADQIRLLESGRNSIRILYEPGQIAHNKMDAQEGSGDILKVTGAGLTDQPGSPMLPVRSVLAGIPLEAEVTLRIVETQSSEEQGYDIAPFPYLQKSDSDEMGSQKRFVKNEKMYDQDQFIPEQAAMLRSVGFLRDQRTAQILFYPVRYNPVRRSILKYNRIVIELGFYSGQKEVSTYVAPDYGRDEEWYRKALINYDQAKMWRRRVIKPRKALLERSLFANGTWIRIKVAEDGVYQIIGEDLQKVGANLKGIDPKNISMYYGGGSELPRQVKLPRPENMLQIPIIVVGEEDGRWDDSDYILFYGQSPSRWFYNTEEHNYSYTLNHYTKQNCYWLTFGGTSFGKRVAQRRIKPMETDTPVIKSYRARLHEEVERFSSAEGSGIEWFWETYSKQAGRKYSFLAYSPDQSDKVAIRIRLEGISGADHRFTVSMNDSPVDLISFSDFASQIFQISSLTPLKEGINLLGLKQLDNSEVRFDWYEIEYLRRLTARGGELFFSAPASDSVSGFQVSGFEKEDFKIFEVSDPFSISEIADYSYDPVQKTFVFYDSLSTYLPKEYYVVSVSKFKKPQVVTKADNSNLRSPTGGADYIVITHDDFYSQALKLADWRQQDSRFGEHLKTTVVKITSIYDEFAWGLFDPTAIRDFLKYTFESWDPKPRYVVLLGNGSYDYKNNSNTSPNNWIPPYESGDQDGFTSDDWFTYFDSVGLMNMAIGRLPVSSPQEAEIVVSKIVEYEKNPERGLWQNNVLMVGDDELVAAGVGNEIDYTVDTEEVAQNHIPKLLDQIKVYLMEYELNSFKEKPGAKADLIKYINKGALIVNYIGHGNYDVLAHEHVLRGSTDIPLIVNGRRLFFLFAASCSIGHFDDPLRLSLVQRLITRPNGGTVAVIAGTRPSYNTPNVDLNKSFYDNFFLGDHKIARLGDALVQAKLQISYARHNSELYGLFGDPAMRLAIPQLDVTLSASSDTIKALDEFKINGRISQSEEESSILSGQVLLNVFDSAINVTKVTYGNSLVYYTLPGATVFKGLFSVENGQFKGETVVPKDISYGGKLGRISTYVWNEKTDGSGKIDSLFVGGTSLTNIQEDKEGPKITLGFVGQDFASNDYVSGSPIFKAIIEDESGINVTGEIGHEIELRVDKDKVFKVTDLFVAENGYRQGSLTFPLGKLADGKHTISLKAWDNLNNSNSTEVQINVFSEGKLTIKNILCFPNPMSSETVFTFQLNQPASIRIKIFTLSGRIVDDLRPSGNVGYNQIRWTPKDLLANGVYLFQITAKGSDGTKVEAIDRIAVVR